MPDKENVLASCRWLLIVLAMGPFVYPSSPLSAQATITVRSANWGFGSRQCNATSALQSRCNGTTSCSGRALNSTLCGDPAYGEIKSLDVSYACGGSVHSVQIAENLTYRLTCSNDAQPQALVHTRIKKDASCDSREGSLELSLPQGYNYCWERMWDWAKAGNSRSSARRSGNGIIIDWEAKPGGFPCPTVGGRGWLNHQWAVAGARPGGDCPPKPK